MQNPWISYVIAALVVSGAKAYASGCESNYQPETLQAHLPCVRIGSSGSVFDVVLTQTEGLNFDVTASRALTLEQARIKDVEILTEPFPVVLAYVELPDSCTRVYKPATVVIDDATQTLSIDIQAVLPDEGQVCLTVLSTQVKAFGFESLNVAPGGTTYTVDVNGVIRTFVYDPL